MSDLARLFAADPLTLTKDDISKMVSELRTNRHKFNSGDKNAGKSPTSKSPRQTKAEETAKAIGIGKIEI